MGYFYCQGTNDLTGFHEVFLNFIQEDSFEIDESLFLKKQVFYFFLSIQMIGIK